MNQHFCYDFSHITNYQYHIGSLKGCSEKNIRGKLHHHTVSQLIYQLRLKKLPTVNGPLVYPRFLGCPDHTITEPGSSVKLNNLTLHRIMMQGQTAVPSDSASTIRGWCTFNFFFNFQLCLEQNFIYYKNFTDVNSM